MLILARREGQRIVVGGGIEITIVSVGKSGVRIGITAPQGLSVLRGEVFDRVKEANRSMRVDSRLGKLEVEGGREIVFAAGLLGLPECKRFVLLASKEVGFGWLQCLDAPDVTLPVLDGSMLRLVPPLPPARELAVRANLTAIDPSTLIVVADTPDGGMIANVLAPLVIDMESFRGAQVVLDHAVYSATELVVEIVENAAPLAAAG
jgi:carbon storage regulator